jgi:hypothetical protein
VLNHARTWGQPFMSIVRQQPGQDLTRRSRPPQIQQMTVEFTQHKRRASGRLLTLGICEDNLAHRPTAWMRAQESLSRQRTSGHQGAGFAVVHAGLGDSDQAFAWLEALCRGAVLARLHHGSALRGCTAIRGSRLGAFGRREEARR